MEKILRSILETEEEAQKIVADAKDLVQKMSQEAGASVGRLQQQVEKTIAEKTQAYLSRVRDEAALVKENILAQAQGQAQALEKQAQTRMSQAVQKAVDILLTMS